MTLLSPDEVRRLREEATPGPWEEENGEVYAPAIDGHVAMADDCDGRGNGLLIAAAPTLCDSYLDVYEELGRLVERLAELKMAATIAHRLALQGGYSREDGNDVAFVAAALSQDQGETGG